MFPICDEQGRVVGFSGRVLIGDEKVAKYVNSPETPIFNKSKLFFGLDKTKRALLDAGHAIVCEGQLDLIACYMAGVQNIVAPQGTAFTAEHARILKRYVDEVILCFDSDAAGQKATVRALDSLLASGLAVRVASVPAPHDPDSFIKASGGEAFRRLMQNAEGFFDYYLNQLCAANDVTSDKGRLAVLREMAEGTAKTNNVVLIDKYAQKTALRLGVSPESVRSEFKRLQRANQKQSSPAREEEILTPEAEQGMPAPNPTELWMLKLVLMNDDLVPWVAAHFQPDWIQHEVVKHIIMKRLAGEAQKTWTNVAGFLGEIDSAPARDLITQETIEERIIPNPAQQIADVAFKIRNAAIDRQMAALMFELNQPENSDDKKEDCMRKQQELRLQKREALKAL